MRLTLVMFAALAALAACSPAEKPAEVASSSEAAHLAELASANAAAVSDMPQNLVADSASASTDGTCLAQIGKAASDRLVKRCIMVSPATHPPCNAQNTCEMIQGEIDRSCTMYGPEEKKPSECTA